MKNAVFKILKDKLTVEEGYVLLEDVSDEHISLFYKPIFKVHKYIIKLKNRTEWKILKILIYQIKFRLLFKFNEKIMSTIV